MGASLTASCTSVSLRDASGFQAEKGSEGESIMQALLQDLRYGARMLLKQKGVTAVAVLSLALGIGANTALFSVVDAMLLKLLPVKEPERLALFQSYAPREFDPGDYSG